MPQPSVRCAQPAVDGPRGDRICCCPDSPPFPARQRETGRERRFVCPGVRRSKPGIDWHRKVRTHVRSHSSFIPLFVLYPFPPPLTSAFVTAPTVAAPFRSGHSLCPWSAWHFVRASTLQSSVLSPGLAYRRLCEFSPLSSLGYPITTCSWPHLTKIAGRSVG